MNSEMDKVHNGPTDAALALRALTRFPDRHAFVWNDGSMTYNETLHLIGGMQEVLSNKGISAGDCVAILSSNRAEYWCAEMAVHLLGGTVSNLHPIGSREGHVAQIAELAPAAVIVDAVYHAQRANDLSQDYPDVQHFTLGGGGQQDLAQLGHDLLRMPQDNSHADQAATLNFTGGTTGRPKPVMRTAGAMAHITLSILADFGLPARPTYLAVAPISHVGGTKIVPVLARGGTIHLMQKFDPVTVLETIARHRINMTLMVPTMIYALLDEPQIAKYDLSSLELLLYGAAPMAPSRLKQGIDLIGPVFAQLYGQTECYPIAVLDRADHDPSRPELLAACGRPVSTVTVQLRSPDGQKVAPGEHGEICVRGPMVMSHYRDRPEETAKALADGWLHTGDVAVADETGRLTIVDRIKDMIVTGGFNVYPKEIENVLASHQHVAMAAIIGVPDEKWGEAVTAYVVAREGGELDVSDLRDLVKSQKGSIYVPKTIHVVENLPMTALGKIDKVALRAPHWSGTARQV